MSRTHRLHLAGHVLDLPIREVAPGISVALFNILGDWDLTERAGVALAKLTPSDVDAFVMPDGKAIALLHVMGREAGLKTIVARKEKKSYMADPIVSVTRASSMTTGKPQSLYLGAEDVKYLCGKKVVIVDDVVSTGVTLDATKELMLSVGAEVIGVMAILTEGTPRTDVISLGHLPLFKD